MSKNGGDKGVNGVGGMNDFVRDAIREKAERELSGLQQRIDAFSGIERARDALHRVASEVTAAVGAYAGMPVADAASAGKLKKLKKLVEEAHALATELGDTLGVDREREALQSQRREIERALESAGLDPATLAAPPPA